MVTARPSRSVSVSPSSRACVLRSPVTTANVSHQMVTGRGMEGRGGRWSVCRRTATQWLRDHTVVRTRVQLVILRNSDVCRSSSRAAETDTQATQRRADCRSLSAGTRRKKKKTKSVLTRKKKERRKTTTNLPFSLYPQNLRL